MDTQTAVVVTVPNVDRLVEDQRCRFDRAAAWGVPAHLTVLYPFVAPPDVDERVLTRLGAAVAAVPAFSCRFARTAWFGDEVLWLAPEPDQPFRDLMSSVSKAFPNHLPYAGEIEDLEPHLTVGHVPHGTAEELRAAEQKVAPALPFTIRVDAVSLLAGTDETGSWHELARLKLG